MRDLEFIPGLTGLSGSGVIRCNSEPTYSRARAQDDGISRRNSLKFYTIIYIYIYIYIDTYII